MQQNFFNKVPIATRQALERSYIDVGGDQFRALAVTFIDAMNNSTFEPETSLKKIVDKIYSIYPQYSSITTSAFLTSSERFKMLVNNLRKSEMLDCLSDVFRQIAKDELCSFPLKYKEIFMGLDRNNSKKDLHFSNSSLFGSVVSQALGIHLILSYVGNNKDLAKREIYSCNDKMGPLLKVSLQVKGAIYFPQVTSIRDYYFLVKASKLIKRPSENSDDLKDKDSETLGETISLVENDTQRLIRIYTQWCQNLLTMIQLNELQIEDLRDLYIEFLPVENGFIDPQSFFENALDVTSKPVESKDAGEFEQLCAEALAGWISMELVNVEQFSDRLEQLSTPSNRLTI